MNFAGFDRADCPPLDMMARLKRETNLEWCGYYLPAPSQSGKGWTGKRAALLVQGWGLAPIFVGQQVVGPGSHVVNATQGGIDGARACTQLVAEGFPVGSWVYLDLENGLPFSPTQRGYLGAWVDAVEAGGFRAGVYCSHAFAKEVAAFRPRARIWAFLVPTTDRRFVDGTTFPAPDPTGATAVASIWQRRMNVALTGFDSLVVDLDCASMRDPSAPEPQLVAVPSLPPFPPPYPTPAPQVSLWGRFLSWCASL